jgi:hypothetical protein
VYDAGLRENDMNQKVTVEYEKSAKSLACAEEIPFGIFYGRIGEYEGLLIKAPTKFHRDLTPKECTGAYIISLTENKKSYPSVWDATFLDIEEYRPVMELDMRVKF